MMRNIVLYLVLLILFTTVFGQEESTDTIFLPKDEVPSSETGYPADRVTYADLEIYSTAQLPEILNSETFAQFGNLTIDGFSYPYINGIPGIYSGVYLDGVRLYGAKSGPFDLKWFPLEILSSATVISTGMISPDGYPSLGGAVDIKTHEMPLKGDYTRLAGSFGDNDNRNYSGMFIKSFNRLIGIGVSASEVSETKMGFDAHDTRNRHFSGTIWSGLGDFDLRLFGFMFEKLNTDMQESYNDSLDFVRDEADHRFFNAKLSYGKNYTFRYNHQDYLQTKYFQENLGFDKSHVIADVIIATADLPIPKAWNNSLQLRGDWTRFSFAEEDRREWKTGGSLLWTYRNEGTKADLGLRVEYTEDVDFAVFPKISISKDIGESYTIFAGGGMGENSRGNWPSQNIGDRFYTAEAGLEYRQADELTFLVKGYYTDIGEFTYSQISRDSLSWQLTENVYGVLSKLEFTPVSYTHLTLPTKRIV